MRSLTGCYIFFGSTLISWKTKKQTTMSRSYVEVEYRSMGSIVCELQWISYLLQDFGFLHSLPIPLWCDNFMNVPNIWRLIVTCFEISSSNDLFHFSTFLPSFKLQTYSRKLYLLLVFLFCCPNWYVNELIIFKSIQIIGYDEGKSAYSFVTRITFSRKPSKKNRQSHLIVLWHMT